MKREPKPKYRKVLHWLNTGIYPASVMFSSGFSYKELITILRRKKGAEVWLKGIEGDQLLIEGAHCIAMHRELFNGKTKETRHFYYIVMSDVFDFSDYSMCKLAHEILHIVQFFMPTVTSGKEIEAEAYLHTHLMLQCLKILRGK